MAYLSAKLDAANADLAAAEAQSEPRRKNFSAQIEQTSEKYLRINGRLSDDAVELFGMCRKLVADLLNDSLLIGKASGRRAEVTDMMKHLEPGD
jgi:recombinational DNA repair ATPase RecF